MRALVTGGAGFIGSHMVDELVSAGMEVHVLDNLSTGSKGNVNPKAIFHLADIREEVVQSLLKEIRPDVVFHMAAQVDVQRSVKKPQEDASINLVGTVNLLEACRQAEVRKIIYSSSCAVYGNTVKERMEEVDPAVPISYYGISKWMPEHYLRIYQQLYGLSYTILRYANVYGPRQTPKGEGGVVAIFLDRIRKGQPLVIYGDGKQTRDFVFVKDVVRANMEATFKGDGQLIHISTSNKSTVSELFGHLELIHGKSITVTHAEERPGDIRHSCLSNQKALEVFGWKPDYNLWTGLKESYAYTINGEQ
ncbi:MAG: NAD-dependent epimerase/dehydratase family protein [Gorillibacterium sp.]|nr:NAD-dependent epimerase/dehydratase family protein [Gorillibacterium sp.]